MINAKMLEIQLKENLNFAQKSNQSSISYKFTDNKSLIHTFTER